jgi:Zn-dependent protease with chaperone function
VDFFAHQDEARRRTGQFVILYLLAVAGVVATLVLATVGLWWLFSGQPAARPPFYGTPRPLLIGVTVAAVGAIIGGTIYRIVQLGGGGRAIAKMVGARMIRRNTDDPAERRLLNVVEEMALASGIAVPLAYVMDQEKAINAFAAGYSPNEAVIAVTRGTLDALTRDELQGVIGHEFSHILNGDMRLNIRLIGVLSGIEAIGSFGLFATRLGLRAMREDLRAGLMLVLPGLFIALVGYVGVFFSRLIKAAVSRQREFLADASAVQFTRNPHGLGGALVKIAEGGSGVVNRFAEEFSHMFFGEPLRIADWYASHPPIEARITRVLGPGAVVEMKWRKRKAKATDRVQLDAAARANAGSAGVAFAAEPTGPMTAASVVGAVGRIAARDVETARGLLADLPAAIRDGVHTPEGARAALFALLAGDAPETRALQERLMTDAYGSADAARAFAFATVLAPLGPRARLPVIELAVPTLRPLDRTDRERLLATLDALIKADRRVGLHEFVVLAICRRQLGESVRRAAPLKHGELLDLAREVGIVLSLLVHAGTCEQSTFVRVMTSLGLSGAQLAPRGALTVESVDAALREINLLAPLKKPAFVKACAEIVLADGRTHVAEGELVRAICAVIDSPLPPMFETGAIVQRAHI